MRSIEQEETVIETFTELDHSYAETVAGLGCPNKRMPNTRRKQYKKVASYAQSHSESRETLRQTHNSVLLRRPSYRGDNREGHDSSDRRYASAYIPGLHSLRKYDAFSREGLGNISSLFKSSELYKFVISN